MCPPQTGVRPAGSWPILVLSSSYFRTTTEWNLPRAQGVNKGTPGPTHQLLFKLRGKHVFFPSVWAWRLSCLPPGERQLVAHKGRNDAWVCDWWFLDCQTTIQAGQQLSGVIRRDWPQGTKGWGLTLLSLAS